MNKSRKSAAQARACYDALRAVTGAVLCESRPADRALGGFFRANRQYGSRDRRLIGESVFAVWRWFGWLRLSCSELAPTHNSASQTNHLSDVDCARVLLGAWLLEGKELPPAAAEWAAACGAKTVLSAEDVEAGDDPVRRAEGVLATIMPGGGSPAVRITDLLPAWSLACLPDDTPVERLVDWLQRRPPLWVRVQQGEPVEIADQLRGTFPEVELHAQVPGAVRLAGARVNLNSLPLFRSGAFEVQDLASQAVGHICAPEPGQRWWDACAGAGGKSLHLAVLMGGKGTVVATDVREYKLKDLRRRARRCGLSNITTKGWDGKSLRQRQATFDGVLVDAPCTCSGTWRRNPDARWRTCAEDPTELAELQLCLLHSAASGLKPNGILVYATCSLFEGENDAVVRSFLETCPEFAADAFCSPVTGAETNGWTQTWPWDGDSDGMFIARFRKIA